MSELTDRLVTIAGAENVLTGNRVAERAAAGWGPGGSLDAKALVRPRSTKEVAEILSLCNADSQPVVVHGGLTNVVGSAVSRPGDVVLSLERMNRIEELDPVEGTVTAQAGVLLQHLQEAAEAAGLHFPVDLGARGSCQIGGMAATNAGGINVLRYGMMRSQVLGLEAVLADGTIISPMQKMLKNNAGYDLKHVFIGSEGTLGVITRLVLRLQEQRPFKWTALVGMQRFADVSGFLAAARQALGGDLVAYEVIWQDYYRFITSSPSPHPPVLPQAYPYYAIIESRTLNAAGEAAFEKLLAQAVDEDLIADAAVAQSEAERDFLWEMRDDVQQLWRCDPLFLFDISLRIRDMESYIAAVQSALQAGWEQHQLFVFGHLGDGNLHIAISAGEESPRTRRRVEEIVYGPLRDVGGSVSAEHGIGTEKVRYLSWTRSEAEIAMMRALKRALDPRGILNPRVLFDHT